MLVSNDRNLKSAPSFFMIHLLSSVGLPHNFVGKAYAGESIFHISDRAMHLSEADKQVIRRHYPPRRQ